MFNKSDFSKLKIPFRKVEIKDLGEVGLILFRKGESEKLQDMNMLEIVQFSVINENGERVFAKDDVKNFIQDKLSFIHIKEIVDKVVEINSLRKTNKEIKKN